MTKLDKMLKDNDEHLSILQRLLHITDLQLKMAIKARKKLYMKIYEKLQYVIDTHKRYVAKHPRTEYMKQYNKIHKDRISQQHKDYYQRKK